MLRENCPGLREIVLKFEGGRFEADAIAGASLAGLERLEKAEFDFFTVLGYDNAIARGLNQIAQPGLAELASPGRLFVDRLPPSCSVCTISLGGHISSIPGCRRRRLRDDILEALRPKRTGRLSRIEFYVRPSFDDYCDDRIERIRDAQLKLYLSKKLFSPASPENTLRDGVLAIDFIYNYLGIVNPGHIVGVKWEVAGTGRVAFWAEDVATRRHSEAV